MNFINKLKQWFSYEHQFASVVFVDDISRKDFWPAKELFYDMIRELVQQVTGIKPNLSLRQKIKINDELAYKFIGSICWVDQYEHLDSSLSDIYVENIDSSDLIIGYELPPALINLFDAKGIQWLDFRISPVRFLPDLLIAVKSSMPYVNTKLDSLAVGVNEIKLSATGWKTNYNYKLRSTTDFYDNSTKDSVIYFVGQTESDASLICNGRILKISDYIDQVREIVGLKKLQYIKHPSASHAHVNFEVSVLKEISNTVEISDENLYEICCKDDIVEFFGISSGGLQEADFFGAKVTFLYRPICELRYPNNINDGFVQIPFQTFCSYEFFNFLLNSQDALIKIPLDSIRENYLRKLHDVWWGYPVLAGKSNALIEAQQRELNLKNDQLANKLVGVLDFVFDKPDPLNENYKQLFDRKYLWTDGAVVSILGTGELLKGDSVVGIFRVSPTRENVNLYFIWYGGWVDKISCIYEDFLKLDCVNNLGAKITVLSI